MKSALLLLGFSLLASPAFAACHEEPIEAFFPRFAADIAVQEAAAPNVLHLSTLDPEADPEPTAILREVARADIEWPVVPNAASFERSGGTISYDDTPADAGTKGKVVTLRGGDNGYLLRLTFTQSPCWQLNAINDDSL